MIMRCILQVGGGFSKWFKKYSIVLVPGSILIVLSVDIVNNPNHRYAVEKIAPSYGISRHVLDLLECCGFLISITSGFRSVARSRALWLCWRRYGRIEQDSVSRVILQSRFDPLVLTIVHILLNYLYCFCRV